MQRGRYTKARFEAEARRREVARLYLGKATQEEIAQSLGVDQSTVSRDVAALMERWKESAALDVGTIRSRELAEVEEMERICMVRFQEEPDPRWIAERRLLKTRKAKLLGLDIYVGMPQDNAPLVTPEQRAERMRSAWEAVQTAEKTGSSLSTVP